ncbi:hypothetical protein BD408DRAFT_423947 [Parasitella parasitica]|nr:hypothetical protein BD408DRAFT_423947 [Parasitella parasitica]
MACNVKTRLNVGGKTFLIGYDTIKKSAVLQKKYGNKHNVGTLSDTSNDAGDDEDDEDDEEIEPLDIFIDRDGQLFQGILEYWRSQTVPSKDVEYLNKLRLEACYFCAHDLVLKVDEILKENDINDDDFEYQAIQHPFQSNYLIKPSEGELKPFEEDATIVSAYKYCLSPNVFESRLVIQRPRKRCKLAEN